MTGMQSIKKENTNKVVIATNMEKVTVLFFNCGQCHARFSIAEPNKDEYGCPHCETQNNIGVMS